MDNVHERIESLCKQAGISGAKMCSDLGMSRSFLTELRKGRAKSIKIETASKIADYFGVTVEYLLGKDKKEAPTLTAKDERDIARDLERIRDALENEDSIMFDGDPAYITTIRVLLFRFTPQISLLYALFYFVFYVLFPAFPAAGTYLVRSQPSSIQQKPPPDAGTLPVHGGDFACLLLCAAGLTLPLKLTVGLPPTCSAGGRPVLYEYGGALTLSFIDLSG